MREGNFSLFLAAAWPQMCRFRRDGFSALLTLSLILFCLLLAALNCWRSIPFSPLSALMIRRYLLNHKVEK